MNRKLLANDVFFADVAEQISSGMKVRIRAKGNSMQPFIRHEKDEIVLRPVRQPVKKGMVVLARTNDEKYVVHRVKKVAHDDILLRGDGNIFSREICSTGNILAEVEAVVRGKKNIRKGSFQWNLYRYLWPSSPFWRRVLLAFYRKMLRKD